MNKRAKLIREQLYELIGRPITPEEIKAFNKTFNNCVDIYRNTKVMPIDLAKDFNKVLNQKAND